MFYRYGYGRKRSRGWLIVLWLSWCLAGCGEDKMVPESASGGEAVVSEEAEEKGRNDFEGAEGEGTEYLSSEGICLQNGYQGNSMAHEDGYYYFRSQAENESYIIVPGWEKPGFEKSKIIAEQWTGKCWAKTYWTVAVKSQEYEVSLQDLVPGESLMLVYEKDGEKKMLLTYQVKEDYNEPEEFCAETFENLLGYDGFCIYENFWGYGYLSDYYAVEDGKLVDLAQSWTLPDGWANGNVNNMVDIDGDGVRELICNVTYLADGAHRAIIYRYDGRQVWCGFADDLIDEPYENFPVHGRGSEYLPEEKTFCIWFLKTKEDADYTVRYYRFDMDKIKWEPYPF